jgi:sulfate transport system ATP-binding protein
VRVIAVQRTGPIVRASAEPLAPGAVHEGAPVTIELPHLHHDVPEFVPGSELRLRLMQFSVYPRDEGTPPAPAPTPVLIGRERERSRAN